MSSGPTGALGIYRDIGDREGEAETLNGAGTLHRVRGDFSAAGTCRQQALDLAREIGGSWIEAHALVGGPAALWPPDAPPTPKRTSGKHGISSSGSAQPRPTGFPPNWTPSPHPRPTADDSAWLGGCARVPGVPGNDTMAVTRSRQCGMAMTRNRRRGCTSMAFASDKPSDNGSRQRQTQRDAPRHRDPSGLR